MDEVPLEYGRCMVLQPVGFVRSPLRESMPVPGMEGSDSEAYRARLSEYRRRVRDLECELVFLPHLEEGLHGIEDFSHILVFYWAHLVAPERRRRLRVHPMGRSWMPARGVFATCSPARPNGILLSPVRLLRRRGNVLEVRGLEALDGSPLLDVKPYLPHYHCVREATAPEWVESIGREVESDLREPLRAAST